MPDMDGIEATARMSAAETVPIILFTVSDLEGLETRASKAGIAPSYQNRRVGISSRVSKLTLRNPTDQFSELVPLRGESVLRVKQGFNATSRVARPALFGTIAAMPKVLAGDLPNTSSNIV